MKTSIQTCLVLCAVALGCNKSAPLQNPGPLQAAGTVQQTEWAIGQALSERGWLVQSKQPGRVVAVYSVRSHRLFANIAYNNVGVQVSFAGSEGLLERREGNTIYIHRKVNTWLKNLNRDIASALSKTMFSPPQPAAQPGPPPPPPAQ